MPFLNDLSSSLLSSATSPSIGSPSLGLPSPFGSLTTIATPDPTAHHSYAESGTVRNLRPNNLEITMQEPDVTVLVKKKIFSSLADNFRYDLMDADEKLFVRASKRLFYNKCRVIAAYERLSKIERIVTQTGPVGDYVLPAIFGSVDIINSLSPGLIGSETQATLDEVRRLKLFSDPNFVTTWLVDDSQVPYVNDTGAGTGVIELTLVRDVTWTNSVKLGGGTASLSVEDPYKLTLITNEDIEQAISDSAGLFSSNLFFQTEQTTLEQSLNDLKSQLSVLRLDRGVPDIIFYNDESTLIYSKARAIIDQVGIELQFTYNGGTLGFGAGVALDPSATATPLGLQNSEVSLFSQIITSTYTLLGLQLTMSNQNINFNQQTNYVRRKMKLFYGGKAIIQPLDIVHIFVNSKTLTDSKISQGLEVNFGANSPLAQVGGALGSLQTSLSSLGAAFGGTQNNYLTAEKNAIVGPDFPNWLWSMMRNDFTRQSAGTQVFCGIADEPSRTYDNGKYTLRVSLHDQSQYFTFGQINISPSVDVYNGDLFDPLTPFKLNFDLASGLVQGQTPTLLDENLVLLNSGSVKGKNGRFRGLPLTQAAYQIQDGEPIASQSASKIFRRKFNDPDGFVRRWKEGIASLTLFGQPFSTSTFQKETAPSLTKDPFAGQDVMNVLSLLVTGQPYNFNTFLQASLSSGNFSRDDFSNTNGASSFFKGLVSNLGNQNQTWGNFVPFKKLSINDSAYNFLRSGQFDLSTANQKINSLLQDRAARFDELTSLVPSLASNPQFYKTGSGGQITIDGDISKVIDASTLTQLASDIIQFDAQIAAAQQDFTQHAQATNLQSTTSGTLKIFGDDISYSPAVNGSSANSETQRQQDMIDFRQQINDLTQRRLWKVKANEDQNLFIVDDSYDKNYDIQGFETALSDGLQLFRSTYTNVAEKVSSVAQILGLEVFADSQGHIQARAPQYNKIPSSVFFRMMQTQSQSGIQLFPNYLQSLFMSQVQNLAQQLEVDEDQIRIRAAVLGAVTDSAASKLLNGSVSGSGSNFSFVTSQDGTFDGTDLSSMFIQANPDIASASVTASLGNLSDLVNSANSSTINFDIVAKSNLVNSASSSSASENDINSAIATIGQRLATATGQTAPTRQSLLGSDRSAPVGTALTQLDTLNVTNQISQYISDRQTVIKNLTNALKNLNQGIALNSSASSGSSPLYPTLSQTQIPDTIRHMIEDETFDDYGYQSGQRFILTNAKIISSTVSEHKPPWTVVAVNGGIANNLVPGPSSLSIDEGGNGISSAFSVDYDMWRMYGFQNTHPVSVPFLSDPEAQCAPYGVFLLNQARKNIFQASVTVVGNEAIQAGEVYYLEDQDQLFYAESVSGSFAFGGQFTSTLDLKFGHNPGEYVPTILDIIGKGLYSNRYQSSSIKHVRHGSASGDQALTVITSSSEDSTLEDLVGGTYGNQNQKNLTNLSTSAATLLATNTAAQNVTLEARIYFNSTQGFSSADSNLQTLAGSIQQWLSSPSQTSISSDGSQNTVPTNSSTNIDPSSVVIKTLDLSDDSVTSSPSQAAWNMARTVATSANSQDILTALFTQVIDIWATFAPPVANTSSPPAAGSTPSQQSAAQTSQYLANFTQRLSS